MSAEVSGKNRGGRPTALTAERAEQLRQLVRCGMGLAAAARTVGVSPRTLRHWRQTGRLDLARELAASEAALAGVITFQTPRSWRAAAYLLEREFPERWVPRQRFPAARRD